MHVLKLPSAVAVPAQAAPRPPALAAPEDCQLSLFPVAVDPGRARGRPKGASKARRALETLLLRKIDALAAQKGYCYAGNRYFTEEGGSPFSGFSPNTISSYISSLRARKLLELERVGRQRRLRLTEAGLAMIVATRPPVKIKPASTIIQQSSRKIKPASTKNAPYRYSIDPQQYSTDQARPSTIGNASQESYDEWMRITGEIENEMRAAAS